MLDITDGVDLGTGWTPARLLLLHELYAKGYTHRAIAGQIGGGLSRNAVIGKASRLGLVGRTKAGSTPRISHTSDGHIARSIAKKRRAKTTLATNENPAPSFPAAAEIPTEPQEFLGLTFEALKRGHCRFPRGEATDITFCGQPRVEGGSYCRACHRIAYYKPRPPANRAPWINWGGR